MVRDEVLTVRSARFADLSPHTLYDILRLRSEVFVVEQDCVFCDPDGRDTDPGAEHLWVEDGGRVVAYLRLLPREQGSEIGRVVTDPARRSSGLGARLVQAALERAPRPVHINAQSRLQAWYEGLGFALAGPEFVEDGIPHLPMVLA